MPQRRAECPASGPGRESKCAVMDATTNNDFVCDEFLASQWLDRVLPCFTDMPERRLLVAVLLEAVRSLQTGGGKQRTAVLAWVRGDNAAARIPFQSLCDGLGMEAAPLARRLLLAAIPGGKPHRRAGVRRRSDNSMRIAVFKLPKKPHAMATPVDVVPVQIPR